MCLTQADGTIKGYKVSLPSKDLMGESVVVSALPRTLRSASPATSVKVKRIPCYPTRILRFLLPEMMTVWMALWYIFCSGTASMS